MRTIRIGSREFDLKRILLIALTVLLIVLAILSCFAVAKRFCRVGRIEIKGEMHYTEDQLREGLALDGAARLYSLDTDALEEKMMEEYPFLYAIKIRPVFPNRLVLSVVEWDTPWYIEISGGKYALNETLLVIDDVEDTTGMTKLILPDVQRVIAGSVPGFSKDENELRKTLEIIDTVRSVSYYERMTEVDVSDRWNIRLVVDGKFNIKLGNMNQLTYKLEQVGAVLDSESMIGAESAEITAENPQLPPTAAIKKPLPLPEETEESE